MGFIDAMRGEGFAVETICTVLREQGVQVAARTYRAWSSPARQVAARTICDAIVVETIRTLRVDEQAARRRSRSTGDARRPRCCAGAAWQWRTARSTG